MEKIMAKTKLPRFKGKPLIEIPEFNPQVGFLEGDFGKAFLEEYNGRVSADYNDNSNLNVLRYDNNVVKGSNPFAVVLANQILRKEGLRVANQADLEKILRINALDLYGFYEDTALVLRTETNPNKYLAKNLAKQVKSKFIFSALRKKVGKTPIVIPLNGLGLVSDSNSPYGLTFKLTDESELIYAPILDGKDERNKRFSETDEYGLPEKLGEGNRTLYTIDSGLSGLYLDGDGVYSGLDRLASSYSGGKVVIVSGKGTSQKNK